MNALERVRKKFGNVRLETDKTDKSPFVSSVGSSSKEPENFKPLDGELERRVRLMALRWQYNSEELADVLIRAAQDPAAWSSCVSLDEEREQQFRAEGMISERDS